MRKIKEVEIEGEKIYLKKDVFGWHTVNPIKKNQEEPTNLNNINWKNLLIGGSWAKLIVLIVIILIFIGAIYEVSGIVGQLNQCLNKTIIDTSPYLMPKLP